MCFPAPPTAAMAIIMPNHPIAPIAAGMITTSSYPTLRLFRKARKQRRVPVVSITRAIAIAITAIMLGP